jgi:hypothetical protein
MPGFNAIGKFKAQTLPFSMSHLNGGSDFPNLPSALAAESTTQGVESFERRSRSS